MYMIKSKGYNDLVIAPYFFDSCQFEMETVTYEL
jgi:hypothetical protein